MRRQVRCKLVVQVKRAVTKRIHRMYRSIFSCTGEGKKQSGEGRSRGGVPFERQENVVAPPTFICRNPTRPGWGSVPVS